jgi:F-box protein 9
MKQGLFIGNWELDGTTVYVTFLTDPSGHALCYVFQMTLQLWSKPTGRWNRLEFMAYHSVDLETGEVAPVSWKHETTPLLFNKVRSCHS